MNGSPATIECYLSLISLWTYIGRRAFLDLVARHNLTVIYKPMDLMAVFAATGGLPVKQRSLARQAYRIVEMQRWRDIRQIPLLLQPKFYPVNPSLAHRMLLAALRDGSSVDAFVSAVLQALWADEQDIGAPATLARLAAASGLDGRALLGRSEDPALLAQENALTREAIERKVFGAPFFFWRGEPFWGQDRLDLLEAMITSGRPAFPYDDP
jgi:2-hydroxychromene-2-carboxylate isomerase